MYLVTRTRVAKPGRMADAVASIQSSKAIVQRVTGRDITLAVPVFGRPPGTVTMAMIVANRADWFDTLDRVRAEPEAAALEQRTDCFETSGEDVLRMVLHTAGFDPAAGAAGMAYSQTWSAQIDHFRFDEAMAWAVDISDHVHGLTGVPIVLAADAYGEFGTLTWVAGLDSAAQADALNEAMLGDAVWRQKLAAGDGLFIPTTVKVWLNRFIA
ncbi:MAG: hypothetical protein AB7G23_19720 [Vicinamibacterales bacterium]